MATSIQVYDSANDEQLATLTRTDENGQHWHVSKATARRRHCEPGDGSIELPLRHPDIAELTYRRVVRLVDNGTVVKSFVVHKIDDLISQTNKDGSVVEPTRNASGAGLGSRFLEMVVTTPNYTGYPQAAIRRYDWAHRELNVDDWDDVPIIQPRDDLVAGSDRPVAWVDGFAVWIYPVSPASPHPSGKTYAHKAFTIGGTEPVETVHYWSMADEGIVALNSVEMQAERLQGPNSVWWWTWKFPAVLEPGTHVLRYEINVVNDTGAAGLIASGRVTDGDGVGDVLYATGTGGTPGINDGWRFLYQPASTPAMTPGQIMRLALVRAAARGCSVPSLSFTDTLDSAGEPWPRIPFRHKVPCYVGDILDGLRPWVEWDMADDGYQLDMVNTSAGTASGVTLAEGTNLTYVASHGEG